MAKGNEKAREIIDLYGKVPPQDTPLEEVVLGTILSFPETYPLVKRYLKPECFYRVEHQIIFKAIIEMKSKDLDVDIATLMSYMRTKNILDDIGGPYAIANLAGKATFDHHIETQVKMLFELFIKREIIVICSETINDIYDGELDILDIKEKLVERLEALFDIGVLEKRRFSTMIDSVLENILLTKEIGKNPDFLTSDTFFDELIQVKPNNIIFIASPPKHGKTKTIILLLHNLIRKYQDRLSLLWYSMEDDIDKVIKNRIAIDTNISYEQQCGEDPNFVLTENHILAIRQSTEAMRNDNIEIIDSPTKISTISAKFRSFCKKNDDKICMLVIDNFNICSNLEDTKENETIKESRIASFIQNLNSSLQSQGYKTIIIVLDHLKKELFDGRLESGYRPMASMLKGSGRKGDILTQLVLLNQPAMHLDLVAEEEIKPDVKIAGNMYKRKEIIDKLLILEKTTSRNSKRSGVVRIVADLGTMRFYSLKEAHKLIKPV